jgi:hypothetical protein
MSESKRSNFYLIFIGLLLGYTTMSFLAPKLIIWFSEPKIPLGITCVPTLQWGLGEIVKWQVIGMLVGAFSLWLLAAVISSKRTKDL